MTSNLKIPKISKGNKMSLKNLVGKEITKKYKFMGQDIDIKKLSINDVNEIQSKAKNFNENDQTGVDLLISVIRLSVKEADELTDEEFNDLPIDELTKLSEAIMKFSGVNEQQGNR